MTPMIDVVFLLLIFFVCTASFQIPEQVLPSRLSLAGGSEVELPLEPELQDLDEIVIRVTRAAGQVRWTINEQHYESLEELRETLLALVKIHSAIPVILDVAGDVPLGGVIDVYDLCRGVGFQRVQFAASEGS